MKRIIRYFYKGALVLEELISDKDLTDCWDNNNPPYQPNNWDRYDVREIEPPYKLYHPSIEKEVVF